MRPTIAPLSNPFREAPMPTTVRTNAGSTRNTWIVRVVAGLGILLMAGVVVGMSILLFGGVKGQEFSPDSFDRRMFMYWELPLLRFRVTKVYYEPETGALEQYLQGNKKLLPPSSTKPDRWNLVHMVRSGVTYQENPAIALRYFDAADDFLGTKYWQQWSKDHPKLAPILWPAVAEVCRGELYTLLPELFDVAQQMTVPADTKPSPDAFQTAINETLARQYTDLADIRRHDEQHDVAIKLYTAAIARDGELIEAYRGRQMSYVAEGETEKAEKDRQRLE